MPSGSPSACSVPASEMFIARPAIIEPSAIWLRAAASGSRTTARIATTADARRLESDGVADRRPHRHDHGGQGLGERVGRRVERRQRRQAVREQRIDERPVGPVVRVGAGDLVTLVVHHGAARHLGPGARRRRDRDQAVRARRNRLDGLARPAEPPDRGAAERDHASALRGVERGAAADRDDDVAARLPQRLAAGLDALARRLVPCDLVHRRARRDRRVGHVRVEHHERLRQPGVGQDLRSSAATPSPNRIRTGRYPENGASARQSRHQVKTTRGMVMPTFHMPMSTIS